MITITLHQNPPGKVKQLDSWQTIQFLDELRRVRILWWISFTKGRPHATVSPEVIIDMDNGGRVSHFELFGGQILYEVKNRHRYQFYMGHLLTFWLLA